MLKLTIDIKNLAGKKSALILLNSLNNVLPQFSTLLISVLVVRFVSLEIWGEYATTLISLTFLTQFISWGNKEYLLREFSFHPSQIKETWTTGIIARSFLLIPSLLILLSLSNELSVKFYIAVILILRFIIQSHDSLVFYYRNYKFKIILEICYTFPFVLVILYFNKQLDFRALVLITLLLETFKTILSTLFFRAFSFSKSENKIVEYLKKSSPFFLLTFTGLIVSRIDQIGAAIFLEATETGKYQIIMGFLLIIQASSNYVLQPFLKNIYRSKFPTIKKVAINLFLLGIFISAVGIFTLYFILLLLYKIQVDHLLLLECYLFVLPIFFYAPYVFSLLKIEKIKFVILLNIVASLLVVFFSACLMYGYGKSIHMLLLSSILTQFILLIAYTLFARINHRSI